MLGRTGLLRKFVEREHPTPATVRSLSGWKALREIKAGNHRFVRGKTHDHRLDTLKRHELAEGQKPHTIVLSCSDSRVPPEAVFDQGLGDIFVVRTAGEVVDASAVASIEYAVENLGSKLLVVLGHESCGAVRAALTTPEGTSAGSPDLDNLVSMIRPNLTHLHAEGKDHTLRAHAKANAKGMIRRLIERSNIVRAAVEKNSLLVVGGLYSLANGEVEFWS